VSESASGTPAAPKWHERSVIYPWNLTGSSEYMNFLLLLLLLLLLDKRALSLSPTDGHCSCFLTWRVAGWKVLECDPLSQPLPRRPADITASSILAVRRGIYVTVYPLVLESHAAKVMSAILRRNNI